MARRYKELEAIVERPGLRRRTEDLEPPGQMLADEAEATIARCAPRSTRPRPTSSASSDELRLLLLPKDPNDDKNVIVEIRGAEGGEEANLFARDLFEMYQGLRRPRGVELEVLGSRSVRHGRLQRGHLPRQGRRRLEPPMKHEGGPHRVQRVPVTESQGRIHTSSATVTVLPEAEEVDVDLDPNDLQIDVYRSSGPAGRASTPPTRPCASPTSPPASWWRCRTRRASSRTGPRPCQVLRSRLLKAEQDRQAAERPAARRRPDRRRRPLEKIRTYNFKENRVTDHRIGLTVYKLDTILAGELDEVTDALMQDERARQLQDAATS